MASFNKVLLMGNLTRDPQVKHLSSTVVAEFGLACNRRFKTASGEDKEEVAFVDCTAFGRQAETIGQFCTKGKPLFVEGRLKYDTWEDKTGGGKRSKLTVIVENFQFIGAKGDHEIPEDMFASAGSASGRPERSDRGASPDREVTSSARGERGGNGGGSADRSERPDGGDRPERGEQRFGRGGRKSGGKAAEQPFGEEKQFEEADIPF